MKYISLVELMDGAPAETRTPDAPTPDEFMPHLIKEMTLAIEELQQASPKLSSTLREQIDFALKDVLETLHQRGQEYGEDLLFLTGEEGILLMVVWKALRMLYSMKTGLPYYTRRDGWRDLAGYAVIAPAMMAYQDDEGVPICDHGFVFDCPEGCN